MSASPTKSGNIGIISIAHMVNDLYANFLPLLVPFLILTRGYSVSAGAALVAAFTITSSFMQPVFGYLVDQKNQRWLVFVGTLWMAALLSTTGYVSSYPLLLFVSALAGFGTAAFHPQAAAMVGQATEKSKGVYLAAFIAMGNIGFAISPLIFLPFFQEYGFKGTWVAVFPGIFAALLLYLWAPRVKAAKNPVMRWTQAVAALRKGSADLNKLMTVVAIRSLVHTGMLTLLPLFLLERGVSMKNTSYMMFAALGAGAVGGLLGGFISDRYGRKKLIIFSLPLSTLFLYGFLSTEGTVSILLLVLGGMTLTSSFSVTVAAAQEIIPENKALASGLSLGFAIGMGGLAVTPLGKFADVFGVGAALQLAFFLPVVAAAVGLLLHNDRPARDVA